MRLLIAVSAFVLCALNAFASVPSLMTLDGGIGTLIERQTGRADQLGTCSLVIEEDRVRMNLEGTDGARFYQGKFEMDLVDMVDTSIETDSVHLAREVPEPQKGLCGDFKSAVEVYDAIQYNAGYVTMKRSYTCSLLGLGLFGEREEISFTCDLTK